MYSVDNVPLNHSYHWLQEATELPAGLVVMFRMRQ